MSRRSPALTSTNCMALTKTSLGKLWDVSLCDRHLVGIAKGEIMTRKNVSGAVCPRIFNLISCASMILVLCMSGLLSTSCTVTAEERYYADQRRGVWKAEFVDWQQTCYRAGGHVIINSVVDRDGIPRHRTSDYACSTMIRSVRSN